uniref:Uncharacterized protein n=1 Tax=Arundo donax TaxID=35708 RepID=A0A0A9GHD2_ARUDO
MNLFCKNKRMAPRLDHYLAVIDNLQQWLNRQMYIQQYTILDLISTLLLQTYHRRRAGPPHALQDRMVHQVHTNDPMVTNT